MPCPSHPPSLDYSNYTWRRIQVMKLLIMQSSPTSRHFGPNILLNTLFSNTLSLCSYREVRDKVSHSYRTTGKNINIKSNLHITCSCPYGKSALKCHTSSSSGLPVTVVERIWCRFALTLCCCFKFWRNNILTEITSKYLLTYHTSRSHIRVHNIGIVNSRNLGTKITVYSGMMFIPSAKITYQFIWVRGQGRHE
jgi:hypothetical protein